MACLQLLRFLNLDSLYRELAVYGYIGVNQERFRPVYPPSEQFVRLAVFIRPYLPDSLLFQHRDNPANIK